MIRIILLGCPGAGKGTQARYLSEYYDIPLIATGDILRATAESGSALGLKVKEVMEKGKLVSDDIIIEIVKDRLRHTDCHKGYLLDGFPRTIAQAEALHRSGIKIDYVIEISVCDDDIVDRLSGRRIHSESGRTYHIKYKLPEVPGFDDLTGEPLVQRDDDREETIRERLRVYHEKTELLINYYHNLIDKGELDSKYIRVDGIGEIEEVRQRILDSIGS